MSADSQIFVPPSFVALFSDARGRLQATLPELAARYELCEDLASHLTEQAQRLHHGAAVPSEEEILLRIHTGLASADSGVSADEARWVTQRLAELLQWPMPAWPEAA